VLDFRHSILGVYERLPWIPFVSSAVPSRKWANDRAYQLITYEDENTGYQTLGPVSKAFHIVCRYAREGPDSEAFKLHLLKVQNFLWMSKDGLMMTGTDGSQLWDLAFMAQAAVETGLAANKENAKSMLGMLDWLDKAQIRKNPKWHAESYRHRTKGAWPFSTPEQGYVVSRRVLEQFESDFSLSSSWNLGTLTPRLILGERLRVGRPQSGDSATVATIHAETHQSAAYARLYRHHPVIAEPKRRLRELRATTRLREDGAAQRGGGVWQYHGRLLVSRVRVTHLAAATRAVVRARSR
jgi:hypothetical protein